MSDLTEPQPPRNLRAEIDESVRTGAFTHAASQMAELWARDRGLPTAAFLLAHVDQLRPHLALRPYRVFILRSFTVEPLVPLLRAAAFVAGIDLDVHVGDFNAHAQELLDPDSALYRCAPDLVILAVQTQDIAPEVWRFQGLEASQVDGVVGRVAGDVRQWLSALRARTKAQVVVHGLEQPADAAQGILDAQSSHGQMRAIARLNDAIAAAAAEHRGVYVLDYDALVARHGRQRWRDERRWLSVRLPIAGPFLPEMVAEWMRFLHPLTGRVAKAIVVDLDNTLWGGVIGEDGMTGIKLGPEYPGAGFQHLQRALLELHDRGVLLAICSKNNADDALEAIDTHAGMLLARRHFAAMRINWTDKAANLREIAEELNIGVDALAFLDDNPVERQHVRRELPDVTVIDLPADPMAYARTVRTCPVFDRLAISSEDRQRGEMYAAQRERVDLERTATSREDFYRSLDQEIDLAPATPSTIARIAQLTQKTNQFNLTTRRYTDEDIARFAASPDWRVLSIVVRDRYGDNGLVGVAITHDADGACEIDTFLLSCRVIARTVETALLSYVTEQAKARGCVSVRGWFRPTKKNAPCRDFYELHGLARVAEDNGASLWELDLRERGAVPSPPWIRVLAQAPV